MLEHLRQLPQSSGSVLLYGGLLLGSLAIFLSLIKDVGDEQVADQHDEDLHYDHPAMNELEEEQSSYLTATAKTVSTAGSGRTILPLTLLGSVGLWQQEKPRAAVFLTSSVGGSLAIEFAVKSILERQRPQSNEDLTHSSGASFPSGHVTAATAFVLALLSVTEREFPPYHAVVTAVGLPFAIGVGVSRSYLQVHFPSDVLAGHALSTAWVLGLNLWYRGSDDTQEHEASEQILAQLGARAPG
jgi:membrane-associated phospholipid phosphatase